MFLWTIKKGNKNSSIRWTFLKIILLQNPIKKDTYYYRNDEKGSQFKANLHAAERREHQVSLLSSVIFLESFTCNTCLIAFDRRKAYRIHNNIGNISISFINIFHFVEWFRRSTNDLFEKWNIHSYKDVNYLPDQIVQSRP